MKRQKSGTSNESGRPAGGQPLFALRRRIAVEAAKLIAEEGQSDYFSAKLKAARRLGCTTQEALPDNHELEAAVREHLAIFQAASQPRELYELRKLALQVMRRLQPFAPQLHGPVLSGTANRFSGIDLELVVDDTKRLELFLLNENIDYQAGEKAAAHPGKPRLTYEFSAYGVAITLTVFASLAERKQALRRAGIDAERADLAALERLLEAH